MEAKIVFTLLLLVATASYTFAPLDVNVVYWLDPLTCVAWLGAALIFLTVVYHFYRRRPVYLVEFACYKPGDERMISMDRWLDMTKATGFFNAEAMDFLAKIVKRSGLGDQTYLPPVHQPRLSMAYGQAEAAAVMFGCLDALFAATSVDPRRAVRAVIVNSSLFSPTPSLASLIVSRYKMRRSWHFRGPGGELQTMGLAAIVE